MSDGGPAFPTTPGQYVDQKREIMQGLPGSTGMSLRDYFAAAAVQGLVARGDNIPKRDEYHGKTQAYCYADMAYALADAMLEIKRQV